MDTEYFFFTLPPNNWRKKPGPSTFKMTIADAAKRHPGATPILSSREVRTTGSGDSTADSPYCRLLRPKTPEEEAHHQWLISRIGAKGE
jgi:hypothetical protein